MKKLQVHTSTIKMLMRIEEVLDSVNITFQEKLLLKVAPKAQDTQNLRPGFDIVSFKERMDAKE